MDANKKTPTPARAVGTRTRKTTDGNFTSLTSIRRRYGRGIPAYEQAKSDWHAANPGAEPRQIMQAMRRIARAVRV